MNTVTVKSKVPVKYLVADMGVRYWEDAEVNGVEDTDGSLIPLRDGGAWKIKIDLDSGRIEGWPDGVTAKTHYKVCDAGIYSAVSANGDVVRRVDGYVPSMLAPNADGFGDYVILSIGPDGQIEGFEPKLDFFNDAEND